MTLCLETTLKQVAFFAWGVSGAIIARWSGHHIENANIVDITHDWGLVNPFFWLAVAYLGYKLCGPKSLEEQFKEEMRSSQPTDRSPALLA